MTSEIRANTLKNRVGLGTVSFTNTGPVVSGIVTISNSTAAGVTLEDNAGVGGSLKITTPYGFVSIGAGNATYTHINTDRAIYYFNKRITVDEGIISSYDENLVLQSPMNTNRVTINKTTGLFSILNDLDVDGHTNLDNGNVAGIVTFNSGAALHMNGGQILLYDRPDGNSNNLFFGTGGRAVAYHDGTNFSIVNNTGHAYIGVGVGSKDLYLYAQASGNVLLQQNTGVRYVKGVGSDASVQLFFNNNLRLNTTTAGVSIPKDLDVDGHTNLDNVSVAGVSTITGNLDTSTIDITGTRSIGNDALQLSFTAPEGHIKTKNTSGSPASNLAFHTTDTSGNTNRVMHLRYDGKVGINDNNPANTLVVKHPGGSGHTASAVLSGDGTTKMVMQTVQGSEGRLGMNTNHPLAIYAGGLERLRIESGGTFRTINGVQSGGNATGGFKFNSIYSGKGYDIAAQYATQANGGSNGNDPVFSGWWGSSNTFRVNTDGKVKYGVSLVHAVQSKGFVLYPNNGSNNKTTIRVSGLVSGCFIFQMGYYNSAGQGEGGFACAVSGYMTTTNQYTIDNIKAPYAHANSSISGISKQNSYFEFTITNNHGSYTGGGTCGIIGDQEMTITVTYHT